MDDIESPPSSPLSVFSKSPSPPCGFDYPSPTPTQLSGSRSTSASIEIPGATVGSDDPPPAKKRKLAEPKERTTEYLDLNALDDDTNGNGESNQETQLQRLLHALRKKRKIVVIAGAGISVSAGIPDFRSSTGLFTTLRGQHKLKASGKHLFDAAVYKSDSSTKSFHDMVRELSHMTRSAKPTLFHHMLATLSEEGRLLRLYTQNVDGIDTAMEPLVTKVPLDPKGPWPKTIQLHGGLEKMVCTKCGELSDFDGTLFESPEPPPCKLCEEVENIRVNHAGKRGHGIGRLRPRMVLYNEFNPDEDAIGAVTAADLRSRPDAVIVVGTSLKVPGVRRIVREMTWVARGRRDGFTAWINNGPEPLGVDLKGCWDLIVRGDCDEVARQAALPKWDDKDTGMFAEATREKVDQLKRDTKLEVIVEIKHKAVESVQGIITPGASPRRQSPAPGKKASKVTQSKLQFKDFATESAPSKKSSTGTEAKKKRASKKSTTTSKPSQTITKSFTVTKGGKAQAKPGKSEKPQDTTPHVDLHPAPLFPNLPKTNEPMQPISRTEFRNNSDFSPGPQLPSDEDELIKKQLLGSSPLQCFQADQQNVGDPTTPIVKPQNMNRYQDLWRSQGAHPVSRTEIYNSNDSSPLSRCGSDVEALVNGSGSGAALLINQYEYGQQKRRETISPPSMPINMSHLMD